MPGSLFLKIFVWFFLALIVVAGLTFVVGEVRRRHEHLAPPIHGPAEVAVAAYAQTAAEIYERGGPQSLVDYMDRMQHGAGLNGVLFDERLQELSGRRVPPGARELAERVARAHETEVAFDGHPPLMGRPVSASGGSQYVLSRSCSHG